MQWSILNKILLLTSGSGLSVVISAASVPVITRLFDPQTYGIYQGLESFGTIFALGGILAIDKALYNSKTKVEDRHIFAIGFSFIVLFSFIGPLIFLFLNHMNITETGNHPVLAAVFLVLIIILRGSFILFRTYMIKGELFFRITVAENARAVFLFFSRALAGVWGLGLPGLLMAGTIGAAAGTSVLLLSSLSLSPFHALIHRNIARLNAVLWKHRKFVYLEGVGGFLKPLGQRGLILILIPTYGADQAAICSVAFLLLLQPTKIIINSVVDVVRSIMAKGARIGNTENVNDLSKKLPLYVSLLTPLILLIGCACIYGLSPILLGNAWQEVATMAPYTIPIVFGQMLGKSLQSVFSQTGRQGYALSTDLFVNVGLNTIFLFSWYLGFHIESSYLISGFGISVGMLFAMGYVVMTTK